MALRELVKIGRGATSYFTSMEGDKYRSLSERFSDFIYVKDYDSSWDGVGDDYEAVNKAHKYANETGKKVIYNVSKMRLSKGGIVVNTDVDFNGVDLTVDWSRLNDDFKNHISEVHNLHFPERINDNLLGFYFIKNGFNNAVKDTSLFRQFFESSQNIVTDDLYKGTNIVYIMSSDSENSYTFDIWRVQDGIIKTNIASFVKRGYETSDTSRWVAYVLPEVDSAIEIRGLNIKQLRNNQGTAHSRTTCNILCTVGQNITIRDVTTEMAYLEAPSSASIRIPFISINYAVDCKLINIQGEPDKLNSNCYVITPSSTSNLLLDQCNLKGRDDPRYEWTSFSGGAFNRDIAFTNSQISTYSMHSATEGMSAFNCLIGKINVRTESKMVFTNCTLPFRQRSSNIYLGTDQMNYNLPTIIFNSCDIEVGLFPSANWINISSSELVDTDSTLNIIMNDCDFKVLGSNRVLVNVGSSEVLTGIKVNIEMKGGSISTGCTSYDEWVRWVSVDSGTFQDVSINLVGVDNKSPKTLNIPLKPSSASSTNNSKCNININRSNNIALQVLAATHSNLFVIDSKVQGYRGSPVKLTMIGCSIVRDIQDASVQIKIPASDDSTYVNCFFDCLDSPRVEDFWSSILLGESFFFGNKCTLLGCSVGSSYDTFSALKPSYKLEGRKPSFTNYSRGYANTSSTTNRPVNAQAGFSIYDTTLNKPIWWNAGWRDSSGNLV